MTSCPLSQGHPCPQFFQKRLQTSIGKDICKDLLAQVRKRERRWIERKRRREGEGKKHTFAFEKRN
jgi:hypothetical protein